MKVTILDRCLYRYLDKRDALDEKGWSGW